MKNKRRIRLLQIYLIALVLFSSLAQMAFSDYSPTEYMSAGQTYYDAMTLSVIPKEVSAFLPGKAYDIAYTLQDERNYFQCSVEFEISSGIKAASEYFKTKFEKMGYVLNASASFTLDDVYMDFKGTGFNREKNVTFYINPSPSSANAVFVKLYYSDMAEPIEDFLNSSNEIPKTMEQWEFEHAAIRYFYASENGISMTLILENASLESAIEHYQKLMKANGFSETFFELQQHDNGYSVCFLDGMHNDYAKQENKEKVNISISVYSDNSMNVTITNYISHTDAPNYTQTMKTNRVSKVEEIFQEWLDGQFTKFYHKKFSDGTVAEERLWFTSKRSLTDTAQFFMERDKDIQGYLSSSDEGDYGTLLLNGDEFDMWLYTGSYKNDGDTLNYVIHLKRCTKAAKNSDHKVGEVTGFIDISKE